MLGGFGLEQNFEIAIFDNFFVVVSIFTDNQTLIIVNVFSKNNIIYVNKG